MNLTIANIEFLKREISRTGLTFSHLQDDMIDHVCCDVEYEMKSGLPFEKAYELVKDKIGMGGLMRIQEETMFLIDKNYRIMKKLMKISGVIAPVLLALGTVFKIQHWPGASILLVLGFFTLGFLFLPSAVYVTYKEVSNRSMKLAHITGFFSAFFIFISFGMKIMHWPGTGIVLFSGVVLASILFLPALLYNKLKEATNGKPKIVYILLFAGFMVYLVGFLFKVQHWPGAGMLLLAGAILLVVIAFPWYVYIKFRDQESIGNNFIFMVIAMVWFIVPTMLISINISVRTLHGFEQLDIAANSHIMALKSKSNFLYDKLLTGNSKSFNETQKEISAARANFDSFAKYINQLKFDIIKLADGTHATKCISQDGQILGYMLNNKTAIDPVRKVLTGNDKVLVQFRERSKFIGRLSSNKSMKTDFLKMESSFYSAKHMMVLKLFEDMYAINALNILSEIEENIRIIENAWLTRQSKPDGLSLLSINNKQQ